MKKNILVPFDGSKNSIEALNTAIITAKAFQEKIIVLNVQPNLLTLHTKMFFNKKDIEEYQDILAKEALENALETLKESECEYEIKKRIGDPKIEICNEAKENNIRWIVMGSRGKGAVVGTVLGSVSLGVLHDAPCPVTIVPYNAK